MIGLRIGATVMMQLGSYQFSISTAAYQELTRRAGYRWASQDRFGAEPALQFTGQESQAVTLSGTIYTEYRGGTGQLNTMRSIASRGQPLPLLDGAGNLLGRWVIESVEEKQSVFAAAGEARKQEFTLQLRKFPGSVPGFANLATAVASASRGSAALSDASPFAAVLGLAVAAASKSGKGVERINEAIGLVNIVAPGLGSQASTLVASMQRGVSAATAMRNSANALKTAVEGARTIGDVQVALAALSSTSSAAANIGGIAASAAKTIGLTLGPADPAAAAVQSGLIACSRMSADAASANIDAARIGRMVAEAIIT